MADYYDQFRFPELSKDDNQIIVNARRAGWAVFYHSSGTPTQAEKTLRGAREFLAKRDAAILDDAI